MGMGCHGFGCWHGLLEWISGVGRWLLAEVGGFGLLGLAKVGGGCWLK